MAVHNDIQATLAYPSLASPRKQLPDLAKATRRRMPSGLGDLTELARSWSKDGEGVVKDRWAAPSTRLVYFYHRCAADQPPLPPGWPSSTAGSRSRSDRRMRSSWRNLAVVARTTYSGSSSALPCAPARRPLRPTPPGLMVWGVEQEDAPALAAVAEPAADAPDGGSDSRTAAAGGREARAARRGFRGRPPPSRGAMYALISGYNFGARPLASICSPACRPEWFSVRAWCSGQ